MTTRYSRRALILMVVPAAVSLVAACSPAAPSTASNPAAAGNQLSDWEQQTLQAAQKEGKVTVYGFWNPTLEQMVTSIMAERG